MTSTKEKFKKVKNLRKPKTPKISNGSSHNTKFDDPLSAASKSINSNNKKVKKIEDPMSRSITKVKNKKVKGLQDNSQLPPKSVHKKISTQGLGEGRIFFGAKLLNDNQVLQTYDVISEKSLNILLKEYKSYGFSMQVSTFDRTVAYEKTMNILHEAFDFKMHGNTKMYKAKLVEARSRFYNNRRKFHSLFESLTKQDAMELSYRSLLKIVEKRYNKNIQNYSCIAHLTTPKGNTIFESVVKTVDFDHAVKLVNENIHKEYGFRTNIRKLYVGSKRVK